MAEKFIIKITGPAELGNKWILIQKCNYESATHLLKVKCVDSSCETITKELAVIPSIKDHQSNTKNMLLKCRECRKVGTFDIPTNGSFQAVIVPGSASNHNIRGRMREAVICENVVPLDYKLEGFWEIADGTGQKINFDSASDTFCCNGLEIRASDLIVEFVRKN